MALAYWKTGIETGSGLRLEKGDLLRTVMADLMGG